MSSKKKVACFFTGGFTELNAMKSFVERINGNADYTQLCPNAPRKSRDSIRNRKSIDNSQSGLTGASLLNYVLEAVKKPYFIRESYDAILIEDDKDARFINEGTASIDLESWEDFKENIQRQLAEKGVTVPVIIFLAAPEIEAWFILDWENSFGQVYRDANMLNGHQNSYFSTVFRKYINDKILTEKYSEAIESYGYFEGEYRKLSGEIQAALDSNDFMAEYTPAFEHNPIRYSKRKQGEVMLGSIDPNIVLQHCTSFFKEGFLALKSL